jgi:ABC-2 type transport system ATP-binding protein
MALIEADNLSKHFRTFERKPGLRGSIANLFVRDYRTVKAVDRITFQVRKGEIVGLIGPNGAGKSTTIKMLTGILVPTSGRLVIDGRVPHAERYEHVKRIGAVFGQRTQLWWDIAVIEAFNLLQKIYEVPRKEYEERLRAFEDLLELKDLLKIPVRKLSLGQRMRCDLAASLLHRPPLVFLDEPTIGLDVYVKSKIREFILERNRDEKTTVILTTHDLSDIEELCPRVMLIDSGRVLYDGGLEALRDRLGKRRKILFEFYRPVREEELARTTDGVAAVWKVVSPYSCECSFEKGEATAARIIEQVSERLSVRDLTVEEPGIEEVVRKIYADRAAEREAE